jgi:hypothetical protein
MQQRAIVFVLMVGLIFSNSVFADKTKSSIQPEADTIAETEIIFTPELANEYLKRLLKMEDLWRPAEDTLKNSLNRLSKHYSEPFDSISRRLRIFPYDSIWFEPAVIVQQDTFPLRWLSDSLFYIDTIPLDKEPFITKKPFLCAACCPTVP